MTRGIRNVVAALCLAASASCGDGAGATEASFNVTPRGGTITLADGRVRLTVPPNAVSSNILITASAAQATSGADLLVGGSAISFSPAGITFAQPVTLTVDLAPLAMPAGIRRQELRLHRITGAGWEVVPGSAIDAAATTASASLTTLPTLAVLALPVTSVSIARPGGSMPVGGTMQLTGIARSAAGDTLAERPIVWTSGALDIATVSTAGLVTGVAPGRVGITATSGASSMTDSITVSPAAASPPPVPQPPALPQVFADGFESGDLLRRQNGVSWVGAPYMDVTSNIARTGSRSARFRQGESGTWGELRFGGLPNLPEVFLQFYLYMPSGTESPSVGPRVRVLGSRNDKFFRLWGSTDAMYSSIPGNKVGASIWGDGTDGSVGQEHMYTPDNGAQWAIGEGATASPRAPLVTDANRGRWVRIRIRCKVSGPDNRSGVIQIWADDTILINRTNLQTYPPGGMPNGYTHGYILGYANNGFQPGQFMYVDDVSISGSAFPQ